MPNINGDCFDISDYVTNDDYVPDLVRDKITAEIRVEDPNWTDKAKARYVGLSINQIREMREEKQHGIQH